MIEWDDLYSEDTTYYVDNEIPTNAIREIPLDAKKRIWTVLDGDSDKIWVLAGIHFVNRIKYIMSNEEILEEHEKESFLY